LEVLGCASGLSHFNFGNCAKVSLSPGSFAPNKSFKPTPHRGVNSVLYATLHAVATPPWGGLTPAFDPGGRNELAETVKGVGRQLAYRIKLRLKDWVQSKRLMENHEPLGLLPLRQ
jgi:hypothetical protein